MIKDKLVFEYIEKEKIRQTQGSFSLLHQSWFQWISLEIGKDYELSK